MSHTSQGAYAMAKGQFKDAETDFRRALEMSEKLAAEFVDAMNGLGSAVKRREDTHKMAEANKAFSHFKW